MRKISLAIFLPVFLFCLTGCTVVSSKYTVGERIDDDLSKQFDGVWEQEGNISYLKYLKEGELLIAGVEWGENHFELEELLAIITLCDNRYYINLRNPDSLSADDSDYLFVHYAFKPNNRLAIWVPKDDVFKNAIKDGLIKGRVADLKHSPQILIREPKDSLCNFFKTKEMATLFDMENPIIYKKIDSIEETEKKGTITWTGKTPPQEAEQTETQ